MFKQVMLTIKSAIIGFGALWIITNAGMVQAFGDKQAQEPSIIIENSWARSLPPVVPNGAAYLSIINHGETDTLLDVSSSIANHSMVHESYIEDGQISMRHIAKVEITAGQKIEFKPGGYHIMLMGLKKPLSVGSDFLVTLTFENAGEIKVNVPVVENKQSTPVTHHH